MYDPDYHFHPYVFSPAIFLPRSALSSGISVHTRNDTIFPRVWPFVTRSSFEFKDFSASSLAILIFQTFNQFIFLVLNSMEIYLLNFIVSDTKIYAYTIKQTSWKIINNKFLNLNYECFFFLTNKYWLRETMMWKRLVKKWYNDSQINDCIEKKEIYYC